MNPKPSESAIPFRVLLIDDDQGIADFLGDAVAAPGIEFQWAPGVEAGYEKAALIPPDLILLDLGLPDGDGMELLDRLLNYNPNFEVIVFSGQHSHEKAVQAIRRGAVDYLTKPVVMRELIKRIRLRAQLDERVDFPLQANSADGFREREGIIGRTPELLAILSKIERIGQHFRTALILGETGTGKDLIARALHRQSGAAGPFVVCNCAALVESLFESELFGFQKGAFTGASEDRIGLFEHANGGTLFLDEIGELPMVTQAKLLRSLQTREVQRIGSSAARKVDVRIVAATNRDLREMVGKGMFREDLYFRLALIQLEIPPLSKRTPDLPLLENHFLDKFSGLYQTPRQRLSRRVQAILRKHSWPGNIRELENVIAYSCMMSGDEVIEPDALPEYLTQALPAVPEHMETGEAPLSLDEMRSRYVARVLERTGGNRARAAQILKIGRATLFRYLKEAKGGSSA